MALDVCVIGGCGHVGLPLAIMLAHRGKTVGIYDKNINAIKTVEDGKIPFAEEGAEPLLGEVLKSGKLLFSASPEMVREADTVIMIIGTPVDEHLNPQFRVMRESINELIPYLHNGQLLVLRSTVYPGLDRKSVV